ncbi:LMBR1 domain-containing protein 1 [Fistulifera solaris]|uniref:LMBR1 domain-containing protein 1 n=1 Tax=Fistulifera solaris TaxID=1519565 RepID=A0A1Z5JFC3_FISSO|nr:LMBR1 domain-containing protein 1 [Fistulifera solaris]|eukprot:GAX12705.1 LMBR1 domain-containing protein 1 [Fistulifera solaris]
MNPFLVISIIVAFVILLIGSAYFIVYYQHPDDSNEAYLPKAIVILGFALSGATVLMLPLDTANKDGYAGCAGYDDKFCGGLNVEGMWNTMFILIPIWVFIFIPFMTFYYEADDGMLMAGTAYAPNPVKKSRIGQAACYELFVLAIVGVFFAGSYAAFGETNIPIQDYEGLGTLKGGIGIITETNSYTFEYNPNQNKTFRVHDLINMNPLDEEWLKTVVDNGAAELTLEVSAATFFGNLMAWVGWFLFALFGGIGLMALPFDLILAYTNRPRHLDPVEYAEIQINLRERVNELVDVGEMIKVEREEKAQAGLAGAFSTFSFDAEKRKAARDERQAVLGFKQAVYLLEQDVDAFKAVTTDQDKYNPLMPYLYLMLGCFSVIISLFWFLHIIVYVFPSPPLAPFLNNFFKSFDSWFPLFGVLSVALFTSYLLLCAVKGCFKFGLRFFFFHIHPMIPGKTYMSSFMFNTALVLLCSLPVVQFCQDAFADYAAFTDIRQIFGVQAQNLKFFSFFWQKNVFVYIFFCLNIMTLVYLGCKPKDQAASGQALRDQLRSRAR